MKIKYNTYKNNRINYGFFRFECISPDNIFKEYYIDNINKVIVDDEHHSKLLYNAKPCIYTDNLYNDNDDISHNKDGGISTKAFIRQLNKFSNYTGSLLHINMINKYHIHNGNKYHDLDIIFKLKPTKDKIHFNFDNDIDTSTIQDEKIKSIVNMLHTLGFYIKIHDNSNYLDGEEEGGKFIDVYGANKRIGLTEYACSLRGYGNGKHNILWDKHNEFNKWSRCNMIDKTLSVDEIINEIIGDNQKMKAKQRFLKLKTIMEND